MVNIVSKFEVPSSNGFDFMMFEDWEENDKRFHESMNYPIINAGACRTAPSTPGLFEKYMI